MKQTVSYLSVFVACIASMLWACPMQAQTEDMLDRKIYLSQTKGSIYQLLENVTQQSGILFIYDSQIINNEKQVKIKKGEYTVRSAIYEITQNRNLSLRNVGNHILIQLSPEKEVAEEKKRTEPFHPYAVIEGILIDQQTQEPISFGTVGIRNNSIGTVTNQNGEFRLNIPDSLSTGSLYFSHVGYLPQEVDISVLINHHTTFSLEPKNISIQEVVVRLVNPQKIIRDMLDKRKDNYASTPVYFTTFYREGVERKKGFVNLSEAVFKVYKNPLQTLRTDQVKLLKMRKISNTAEKDTIITKIKSGVNACLLLDLVKNLPDFLSPESLGNYEYRHTDLTLMEDRMANVITFEQRVSMKVPLYKGDLYIDTENDALLMAKFEMNPDHIKAATSMFIEKKSRNLSLKLDKVQYAVSYKYWDGKYYINHIRGDLHFKVRTKKQFFSSPVHTWFEMVTCDIETEDVSRFMRNETFPQTTVFSDVNFVYDNEFWGNFNIILPEEELHEAISKITSKIEETNL